MSEVTTTAHIQTDGSIVFNRSQDTSEILEENKRERIENEYNKKSFGRKVATIPNIILIEWHKEGIDYMKYGVCPETTKEIKKRLNSPDWRMLRTSNTRI